MAYLKENTGNFFLSADMYSLKTIILICLCLQNASYTLLRKYTTKYENVSSKEILLISELVKMVFSVYMVLQEDAVSGGSLKMRDSDSESAEPRRPSNLNKLVQVILNSQKMLVLAIIYGIMNILSFVALQYIGAGEFTICAQLKILTTAVFSTLILQTPLTATKWRALILLVLGCILVASPVFTHVPDSQDKGTSLTEQIFGYSAVLTEVVLSGFASIYFEKVIKNTVEVASIWERNLQLGFYSILMYGFIVFYESSLSAPSASNPSTVARSAWSNWSWITLTVAILGAVGGLLVAATLKYADSILKTLAAAGAIVLSTILGHYFLDGPLDAIVSIGGLVTILSIANYTLDATSS